MDATIATNQGASYLTLEFWENILEKVFASYSFKMGSWKLF